MEFGILRKFIRIYQSENPLSFSEWTVVKFDLMFPHLFLGAMNKFYYKETKNGVLKVSEKNK